MATVLITGANRGIGLALAQAYTDEGARVIATCRTPGTAGDLSELAAANPAVDVRALDVADLASIAAFAATVVDERIDILINNAAINGNEQMMQPIDALDFSTWQAIFATNVTGPFALIQALLPRIDAGDGRKIINISSTVSTIFGKHVVPGYGYRASKAALNLATRHLATELENRGIVVGLVCPGWVKTGQGGPHAPLSAAESAEGVKRTIASFSAADSGGFKNERGEWVIPFERPEPAMRTF